ncbi:MAG: cysteine synthase [Planctomycetes bacterium]|nr:cysteine synthase [Planctomycetota bacterium]
MNVQSERPSQPVVSSLVAPVAGDNPVDRLLPLVGGTPLIEISFRYEGRPGRVFAKYEALNYTGSIKDRMALHILARGWESGALVEDAVIVEASSGNTAISFAAFGRALGHPVRIMMPEWMSVERKALLRSMGAALHEVTADEGGFLGSIAQARAYGAEHSDVFLPEQFTSEANVQAHACGTGPEILAQLGAEGLAPGAFVAGVGTGGTIMGVGQAMRAAHPSVRIHPVEPAEAPVLSCGPSDGHHRIQGISDEFIPDVVDLDALAPPLAVSDGDAILMAQRLSCELGLAVGISSGANVIAAIRTWSDLGPDAVVATVLPDSNKKYLSTDLFRDEPTRPDYLTPRVELFARWRALAFEAGERLAR